MKNLNVSARDVGLDLIDKHIFPWKWNLSDLKDISKNNKTVFSCFSCGGGSSMGYKLAGYTVLGNCEIDPKIMEVYKANHNPKYSYLMDIRDFAKLPDNEIPEQLKNLDILDGSPPCSVFSMAGDREKAWDKEKTFREGQKAQKLDDLFFYFIEVAKRLQPKVVIAENVKGLITGNAKGYVNEILKAFDNAGYSTQIFLLNSAKMGVPQKRERVFFIAHRKDLKYPKIKMDFNEKPILFGEVRSEKGKEVTGEKSLYYISHMKKGDKDFADIKMRLMGKHGNFSTKIIWDNDIAPTLVSNSEFLRAFDKSWYSEKDCISVQTFPQDYNFKGQDVKYICGMSVPPVMMAQIARTVYNQWLK